MGKDLSAEVKRSFLSSGRRRQEQSGRLARNSLCLGVWDGSNKFTVYIGLAGNRGRVRPKLHTHTHTHNARPGGNAGRR